MRTKRPSLPRGTARRWQSRLQRGAGIAGLIAVLALVPVTIHAITGVSTPPATRPPQAESVDPPAATRPTTASVTSPVRAVTATVPRGTPVAATTASTDVTSSSAPLARGEISDHRVLAFLYPWFGAGAATDPELSVHPATTLLTYRLDSSTDAARMARAQGIDGFILSFAGAARQGLALHQTLEAASATGGTATVVIETREAGTAAVSERWVREALRQSDHPAFQRLDGTPVIFAFASGTIPASAWGAISRQMATEGHPVKIIGDVTPSTTNLMAGQYRYNALMRSPSASRTMDEIAAWNQILATGLRSLGSRIGDSPQLVVATVQPGWDDRRIRGAGNATVDRNGTATYDQTWAAALAAKPDWVVITSWNEWYEGTGIAPSAEHGTSALDATSVWSKRFKLGGGPSS